MTSTQINQENYTAYQPYMLLDFNFSYKKDVTIHRYTSQESRQYEKSALVEHTL